MYQEEGLKDSLEIDCRRIIAVEKDDNKIIKGFKFLDGTRMDYKEAMNHVAKRNARNLVIGKDVWGKDTIRCSPNNDDCINISNLPTF